MDHLGSEGDWETGEGPASVPEDWEDVAESDLQLGRLPGREPRPALAGLARLTRVLHRRGL